MEEKDYKYMVGVRCFTFNQSRYILDSLNGFVMQQTNFPFVIMVVDDASTDGEQDVIAKFISEQFDTTDHSVAYEKETDYAHISYAQHKINKNCYIAALYLKENHYSQRKTKMPYLSEWRDNAKYEALCEGDDYWIDALKLQKQVDFLESHEDYGLVYGKAKTYIQNNNKWGKTIGEKIGKFEDLLVINPICTLTTMYRISSIIGYDDLVKKERRDKCWKMGDYPLWLFISTQYKVHFIDELLSVYRVIENSASHAVSYEKQKEFLYSYYEIKYFFIRNFCNNINDWITRTQNNFEHDSFRLAYAFNKKKDAKLFFSKIKKPTIKELIKYLIISLYKRNHA